MRTVSLSATLLLSQKLLEGATIHNEMFVKVMLTPGVRLAGRIDTVIEWQGGGIKIIDRKSGAAKPWHPLQVRLYREMLAAGASDARMELRYSRDGTVVKVERGEGGCLESLREAARKGEALDAGVAGKIVQEKCAKCSEEGCGLLPTNIIDFIIFMLVMIFAICRVVIVTSNVK